MSQPVKISDELILDARLTAEVARRSIAGQIEYWAQLGRAIEPLLDRGPALALCRAGAVSSLSECLASVDSAAGRRRVVDIRIGAFPALSTGSRFARIAHAGRCSGRDPDGRSVRRPAIPGRAMAVTQFAEFDRRPIIVAIAGPNGAGKTTFFRMPQAPPYCHDVPDEKLRSRFPRTLG